MALENTAGLGVLNQYGPRNTSNPFGGRIENLERTLVIDIDVPSGAGNAGGFSSAAWAVEGLDYVIESGSVFVSADLVVETAFNTLTALTVGTYQASDGTTAISAAGLITAAGSALTTIDAVGDRLVGNGAQLVTGTAGLGALTADAVVRVLYTGAAPTTGKARLIVKYLAPTP